MAPRLRGFATSPSSEPGELVRRAPAPGLRGYIVEYEGYVERGAAVQVQRQQVPVAQLPLIVRSSVHEGPDGGIAHAELRFGDGMIMLGPSGPNEFGLRTPRELGAVSQGVYVIVDDIAGSYERARAAGAEILRELADTDYGSQEFMARDPEGNIWSFGTYRPD